MAFRPAKKPPQFADLKGILTQSKETDNPLYQVVQEIIERLTQAQVGSDERIQNVVKAIIKTVPTSDETPTGTILETDIVNGTLLARVADNENITGVWTFTTNPVFNAGAIPEEALVDGGLLSRNAGNEVITGTWTFTTNPVFNANSIPETAIIDGALLARVAANETITGSYTFSNGITTFQHPTVPLINIVETGGLVDGKRWRFLVVSGSFNLQIVDDAISTAQNALQVIRNAYQVVSWNFYTNNVLRTSIDLLGRLIHTNGIIHSGRGTITLSGDQTAWNPTGLGTTFFLSISAGSVFNVRGILAQTPGYIVTFHVLNASVVFVNEDASASAANRMWLGGNTNYTAILFGTVTLYYDGAFSRWIMIGKT
jgi:hypothetical protein